MTYGSNRSSKTASNAIANKKRNDMPEFNGIGSLPKMPARKISPMPQLERIQPGVGGYGGGDFMPVANEGPQAQGQFGPPEGFAPQMVAPPQPQYMPPQYMPPQQMYPPVPQYTQPQPRSVGDQNIYSRLDDMMLAGMDNKTIYDQYRQDDWTRDRSARGWDMFAGGVLNPLASMFVRDPAARNRMMQSGNQQAYRYDNMRQLRNNERQAQFNEDKYYTDMRMANDPNSFENWAKQQELQTGRMNANNGLMSQQGLAQWRMMQDQNADLERQRKAERDSNDFDIRNRQLEAMSAYRQGQLALGDIRNKISQQNANTTAGRAASLNSVDAKRQQLMSSQIDKIQQDIEDAVLRGDLNRVKSRLDEINTLRQMYAIDEKGNPKVDAQGFAQAKLPAPKSATAKKAEKKKGLLDGLMPQAKPAQSTQPNPANPIPANRASATKPPMSKAELEKLLKAKGWM